MEILVPTQRAIKRADAREWSSDGFTPNYKLPHHKLFSHSKSRRVGERRIRRAGGPVGGARAKAVQETAELNKALADPDQPANIVPAGLAHMKNFLECVATRTPPIADIREGYISTTTCLLGNIAQDLGRTLKWDAKTQQVTADAEANTRFAREYRAPWVYPTA